MALMCIIVRVFFVALGLKLIEYGNHYQSKESILWGLAIIALTVLPPLLRCGSRCFSSR